MGPVATEPRDSVPLPPLVQGRGQVCQQFPRVTNFRIKVLKGAYSMS